MSLFREEVKCKMIGPKKKILYSYLYILFSMSILSACGSGLGSESITSYEQVETNSGNGEGIPSNPSAAEEPASTDGGVDAGYSLGYSLGESGLRATDPSTVNLASGEIQLVEFFAYW